MENPSIVTFSLHFSIIIGGPGLPSPCPNYGPVKGCLVCIDLPGVGKYKAADLWRGL